MRSKILTSVIVNFALSGMSATGAMAQEMSGGVAVSVTEVGVMTLTLSDCRYSGDSRGVDWHFGDGQSK